MASLRDEATNYVPKETKNITALEKVSIDIDVQDGNGTNNDGKDFEYKFTVFEEEEYRIPLSVLGQLKEQLKGNPDLKFFRVTSTGAGLKTKYTVIPLPNTE